MVAVRPHEQLQSADSHLLAQRDAVLHHPRLVEPKLVTGPDHTDDARTRQGVTEDHEGLIAHAPFGAWSVALAVATVSRTMR